MIKFEMHETLPDHVIDRLWEQNINMNDWDYVLFVSDEHRNQFYEYEGEIGLTPQSRYVEDLLRGCYDNIWYSVKDFGGRKGILGVAYHA